ncbi:MAG: glycosyltransferase [Acidimicrobiales bacterium]
MTARPVDFEHLFRMSDDTGLFEHARGAVARREHGYCVDDVARGLVVLAREEDPTPRQVRLADVYLAFVAHAQDPAGSFRNRLGYDRRWSDLPGTGDWWGRAMWSLGSVVAGTGPAWQRAEALDRFSLGCRQRSRWLRPMAYAGLGAAQVLVMLPDHDAARRLLVDFVGMVGPPVAGVCPWPEDRLTYDNARIPDALLAAGAALGDGEVVRHGIELLDWLVRAQMVDGHLSPVPAGGSSVAAVRSGFDQQPIEVAGIADAAARAFTLSGEVRWCRALGMAARWFDGANDVGAAMHDPATGGGFDGLTATGPNINQGAESTLAWLLTRQLACRIGSERVNR